MIIISFVTTIYDTLCPLQHIHLVIVLHVKITATFLFNLVDMYFFPSIFYLSALIHFGLNMSFMDITTSLKTQPAGNFNVSGESR